MLASQKPALTTLLNLSKSKQVTPVKERAPSAMVEQLVPKIMESINVERRELFDGSPTNYAKKIKNQIDENGYKSKELYDDIMS